MSVDIVTFGCRLNAYESEAMKGRAAEAGLADAVIVNTCAVTNEAVRQARQTIRRLKRERPGAPIIVTGCAAQTEPNTFAAMPEVDHVLGNEEKLDGEVWHGLGAEKKIAVGDIMSAKSASLCLIESLDGRARAFVQVQNGCDHRCTFCIIPYGRGNSRSVPMDDVVAQVRRLVENGTREVVLTAEALATADVRQTLARMATNLKRLYVRSRSFDHGIPCSRFSQARTSLCV